MEDADRRTGPSVARFSRNDSQDDGRRATCAGRRGGPGGAERLGRAVLRHRPSRTAQRTDESAPWPERDGGRRMAFRAGRRPRGCQHHAPAGTRLDRRMERPAPCQRSAHRPGQVGGGAARQAPADGDVHRVSRRRRPRRFSRFRWSAGRLAGDGTNRLETPERRIAGAAAGRDSRNAGRDRRRDDRRGVFVRRELRDGNADERRGAGVRSRPPGRDESATQPAHPRRSKPDRTRSARTADVELPRGVECERNRHGSRRTPEARLARGRTGRLRNAGKESA